MCTYNASFQFLFFYFLHFFFHICTTLELMVYSTAFPAPDVIFDSVETWKEKKSTTIFTQLCEFDRQGFPYLWTRSSFFPFFRNPRLSNHSAKSETNILSTANWTSFAVGTPGISSSTKMGASSSHGGEGQHLSNVDDLAWEAGGTPIDWLNGTTPDSRSV